jgi:hypothetical protein
VSTADRHAGQPYLLAAPPAVATAPCTAAAALNFVPATGITVFGWTVWHLLGVSLHPLLPLLWFAGGLLVYNLDRAVADPADLTNIPGRVQRDAAFADSRRALMAAAALLLVAGPLLLGAWQVAAVIGAGTVACVGYSVRLPLLPVRIKDVPVVKTFFPALAITVALMGTPLLLLPGLPAGFGAATVWVSGILLANVIVCDLRDLRGDRDRRVVTLAVLCGGPGTVAALAAVFLLTAAATAWQLHVALGTVGYLAAAAVCFPIARARQWYYDYVVDGVLFVPLLLCAV